MNYDEFKKAVTLKFMDFMPDKYQEMELCINPVYKINESLDAISLNSGKGRCVSPTLYINDMYDTYVETGNLSETLRKAAEAMDMAFGKIPSEMNINFNAKDNIIFQVVNTEQNKKLLNTIPHREFLDLSIIYRLVIKMDKFEMYSAILSNQIAEQYNMSEEELFNCAIENTERILKPTVMSMHEFVAGREMPVEMADIVHMMCEAPDDKILWVLSNEKRLDGAGCILYENLLHKLAERIGTNLYIIPASMNECIVVSTNMADLSELEKLVRVINANELDLKDKLSDRVYLYDKVLRKLTFATESVDRSIEI